MRRRRAEVPCRPQPRPARGACGGFESLDFCSMWHGLFWSGGRPPRGTRSSAALQNGRRPAQPPSGGTARGGFDLVTTGNLFQANQRNSSALVRESPAQLQVVLQILDELVDRKYWIQMVILSTILSVWDR